MTGSQRKISGVCKSATNCELSFRGDELNLFRRHIRSLLLPFFAIFLLLFFFLLLPLLFPPPSSSLPRCFTAETPLSANNKSTRSNCCSKPTFSESFPFGGTFQFRAESKMIFYSLPFFFHSHFLLRIDYRVIVNLMSNRQQIYDFIVSLIGSSKLSHSSNCR